MLGRMAPSPNSLCSLRSRRSDSGDESEDEARRQAGARATRPALLGVADSPRRAQPVALPWRRWCSLRRPPSLPSRQAAPGRGDLWGAEKRSAAGGVRRAAPDRRGGSMRRRGSAVAEPPQPPRGASIAGQSRAAGPPQCEPLSGAACRDAMALKVRSSRQVSTSAMRRQPTPACGALSARRPRLVLRPRRVAASRPPAAAAPRAAPTSRRPRPAAHRRRRLPAAPRAGRSS